MASVFTFDPDPPGLTSPWPRAPLNSQLGSSLRDRPSFDGSDTAPIASLADYGISILDPEPQEGPIEYKLHLLLRPRHNPAFTSRGHWVSGSCQSRSRTAVADLNAAPKASDSPLQSPTPSNYSRQNRLQGLTTQLLWRLQQSSPYHSSVSSGLVLPLLPNSSMEAPASVSSSRLLSTLGESQGALYEIGISDDGTFVGLMKTELIESLANLRVMASSLSCRVEVLRLVFVGDCQWTEDSQVTLGGGSSNYQRLREETLWVAEARIHPDVSATPSQLNFSPIASGLDRRVSTSPESSLASTGQQESRTEQLRIALTGSTTSGKSSLLGTLSTSALDNGRGKSRLTLLKHPHEIASGLTSSVAPELIGYKDTCGEPTQVVNYASKDVSSWQDVHSLAVPGRLVFINDSAGHPRFRRTAVRGLMSWAPHWALCCIAADNDEDSSGRAGATAKPLEILGPSARGLDLSKTHIEICLKLDLPLIVVITKFDLATKLGLRQTLTKVLSTLKSFGREPHLLSHHHTSLDLDLKSLSSAAVVEIKSVFDQKQKTTLFHRVPIIFSSTVTGDGIGKLHALLRHLPIPSRKNDVVRTDLRKNPSPPDFSSLFHIDDVFATARQETLRALDDDSSSPMYVLNGYLSHGSISVGDQLLVGPYAANIGPGDRSDGHFVGAKSLPDQDVQSSKKKDASTSTGTRRVPSVPEQDFKTSKAKSASDYFSRNQAGTISEEPLHWRKVRIASLRNLRLPVNTLLASQVGSVGIVACDPVKESEISLSQGLRKGMVLIKTSMQWQHQTPSSYNVFVATFNDPAIHSISGSTVIVYIASIRSSARVLDIKWRAQLRTNGETVATSPEPFEQIEVKFEFINSREWVETGAQVLVMPADNGGMSLDGFVGRIRA